MSFYERDAFSVSGSIPDSELVQDELGPSRRYRGDQLHSSKGDNAAVHEDRPCEQTTLRALGFFVIGCAGLIGFLGALLVIALVVLFT